MKNKKPLITVAISALFIALATTSISVAWFSSIASTKLTDNPIGGIVQDTYYESGTGHKEDDPDTPEIEGPYIITRPRHLYNLAWLQDLGFYNGQYKEQHPEDDRQFYFKLGDNIDMSSFGPIPPIGTEQNPFVGNFDGRGFVISGVTISNDFKEYNSHPSVISGWNGEVKDDNDQPISQPIEKPHILGLFGVVGDYTNANKPTSYSSSVNEFKNTGITGATIKTSVNDTLMGVAAGYVSGNMSNVLVDVSTVDVSDEIVGNTTSYGGYTQNISDYTLVGYTKNIANVKKAEQSIYDVEITSNLNFNAVEQANDEGWGGSINMKTIYYRLASLRKTKSTNVAGSFAWRVDDTFYNDVANQSEHSTYTALSTSESPYQSGRTYSDGMSRYVGAQETGHEYIGNYNIYARAISQGYPNTGDSSADQQFMYLSGGHYENKTYNSYYNHSGYYITDGTNYLSLDGVSLTNHTNSNQATLWSFSNTSGTATISTQINGVTYYLRNDSGTLAITTDSNQATSWSLTFEQNSLKITSGTYKIIFYSNQWLLSNGSSIAYYVLSQNNRYMTTAASGSTPGNTNNVNNASHWYIEPGTNYLYHLSGSEKRYLAIYYTYTYTISQTAYGNYYKYYSVSNETRQLRLINNSNSENYYYFTYNSGTPVAVVPVAQEGWSTNSTIPTTNTNHYFRYNNNVFTYNTGNNNLGSCTQSGSDEIVNFVNLSVDNTLNGNPPSRQGPDYHQTSSDSSKSVNNSHMYYTPEDTTYFPLNVQKDIESYVSNVSTMNTRISNGDLDPMDSNTGYIVSGSTIASDLTTLSSASSNIRISEYTIADVNASFNKSAGTTSTIADLPESKIYTINSSGSTVTMDTLDLNENTTNYPRYADSKVSFYQNSLTTPGNNETFITNSYVYGLHFMASTISKQSIVHGNKVSILGNKSDNYELPVDCIDFNLKQKGIINFFAGTYFSGNNSFFSLYQIIRNDDATLKDGSTNDYSNYKTINDIKEIVAVYSNDTGTKTTKYSNIYKYKTIVNGNTVYTYSEPYRFDGNMNKFKMNKNSTADLTTPYVDNYEMSQSDFNAYATTYGYSQRLDAPTQIGKQASTYTSKRIYYFEIPMNDGEYCLGSVAGGTGAYLLYLDIGANAAKTERTIFYEHFTINEKTYTYPLGVSLNDLGDPANYPSREAVIDITEVVDSSDSACMRIIASAKGEFTIDRSENSVALTRAQTNKAPPVYNGEDITRVYDTAAPSVDVTVESLISHSYDIKRMEYYDYNVNLEYLTVTTFVDYADDNGDYYRGYVCQTVYSGDTTSSPVTATYKYYITDPADDDLEPVVDQRDSMKIYSTTNGIKYGVDDILSTSAILIDDSKMSDDLIVTFKIFQDGGNTYEDATTIATHIDLNNTNGKYYLFDNYIISFIPTSGSTITIKVTDLKTGATVYYETTPITGAGQVIVEGPQP